jgi:hypothetical protein
MNSYNATGERRILASYVPADLERAIAALARENDRTKSAEIRHALRRYVAAARRPSADAAT